MKIDKEELAQKINALEGLDNETKSQLLELLHERKRYGLVWEEKEEDVEERLRTELPVLREVKDKYIPSDDPDAPNHILIEGDNLEALTALSYTHEGKIDVIYIDPPYNTGAKNWKYNNDYVDDTDTFRHSKWLSMMNKRLLIAKKLLSVDGILVLTIDDYEIENITLLLNSIFGEDHRLATIVVKNNPSGRSTISGISVSHEYALFYAKSKSATLGRLPRNEKQIARYKESDSESLFEWVNFRKHGGYKEDAPSMYFPIYIKKDGSSFRIPQMSWNEDVKEYSILEEPERDEFVSLPIDENGRARRWKWSLERTKIEMSEMSIRQDRDKKFAVYIKSRMKDEGMLPLSVWDDKLYSSTEYGANLLTGILGGKLFDYPKSLYAVIDSLKVAHINSHSTILDFFAGSGTTLHATMQLNKDGGNRQCILVTNNENNICEEVTYERNKRVINGYTTPKGEKIEGLHNNTLRYYKTDFVARESSATAKKELMTAATDMLCIKNNVYTEHKEFGGRKFRKDVLRYFADGENQMLVIYNPEVIEKVVEILKETEVQKPIIVYVFSLNDYAMNADFEEVGNKVSVCALPAAIYRAYLKVLPRKTNK